MSTPYEIKTYLQADTLAVAGLEEVGGQAINSSVTLTTGGPSAANSNRVGYVDPSGGIITITLPVAVYTGYRFRATNVSSSANAITLDGNGYNINGNPTASFSRAYGSMVVEFTGSAYIIIGEV